MRDHVLSTALAGIQLELSPALVGACWFRYHETQNPLGPWVRRLHCTVVYNTAWQLFISFVTTIASRYTVFLLQSNPSGKWACMYVICQCGILLDDVALWQKLSNVHPLRTLCFCWRPHCAARGTIKMNEGSVFFHVELKFTWPGPLWLPLVRPRALSGAWWGP